MTQPESVTVPVAERSGTYLGTDGTRGEPRWVSTAGRYGRTVHRVMNPGATQLRLVFHNWVSLPAAAEAKNPGRITVRCAVEYPAGVWRRVNGSTAYQASTVYRVGDQVTYGGAAWLAVRNVSGHTPAQGTYWTRVLRYPVTFGGSARTATVQPGGDVYSDPVRLSTPLRDRTRLAVRTQMNSDPAVRTIPPCDDIGDWDFAVDYPSAAPAKDLVDTWETTQRPLPVATGSTQPPGTPADPSWDAPANKLPRPGVILGDGPNGQWTALLGDSLVQGYLDRFLGADSYRDGFAVRAWQAARYPWRRTCQGGSGWDHFTPAQSPRRYAIAASAPAVLVDLGGNDVNRGRALADMQADAIAGWWALGGYGARVWQTTMVPRTNSRDNWRTAAQQTFGPVVANPAATPPVYAQGAVPAGYVGGGTRDGWNAWLRSGAPIGRDGAPSTTEDPDAVYAGDPYHPLTGVVDISAAVEDPGNGALWKTNGTIANLYTMDGGHGSPTGYALLGDTTKPYVARIATG